MILSPKHLPRLVATIRLFTNYGLRGFANRQGLLSLEAASLDGDETLEGDSLSRRKRSVSGSSSLDPRISNWDRFYQPDRTCYPHLTSVSWNICRTMFRPCLSSRSSTRSKESFTPASASS